MSERPKKITLIICYALIIAVCILLLLKPHFSGKGNKPTLDITDLIFAERTYDASYPDGLALTINGESWRANKIIGNIEQRVSKNTDAYADQISELEGYLSENGLGSIDAIEGIGRESVVAYAIYDVFYVYYAYLPGTENSVLISLLDNGTEYFSAKDVFEIFIRN